MYRSKAIDKRGTLNLGSTSEVMRWNTGFRKLYMADYTRYGSQMGSPRGSAKRNRWGILAI